MAAPIAVSPEWLEDWHLFVGRAGLDRVEQNDLRAAVREDFAGLGAHIAEMATVYRFCDQTWGGLPSAELARGYCASRSWWPADETIWNRLGPLLLAKLCAQVAGVVPWPSVPG